MEVRHVDDVDAHKPAVSLEIARLKPERLLIDGNLPLARFGDFIANGFRHDKAGIA